MMRCWRSWLTHLFSPEGFRGPVLTLLSGTSAVLVLSYLTQPILTRLYTPEEFGLAVYFRDLLLVLASFTSLRYDDAILLPEDDEDAAGIVGVAFTVLMGFMVVLIGALIWRHEIAALLGLADLAFWLILIPPTLLAIRLGKLAEVWLTRIKRFRSISTGQVTLAVGVASTRIGAGIPPLNAGAGGLIVGYLVGQVMGALVLGGAVLRRSARYLRAAFRPARLKRLAYRYRHFPLFTTPSTLLNTIVTRLPVLLLPFFFDQAVIGLYDRAFIVLAVPFSYVGMAIARVFFVHAAEAHRTGGLSAITGTVHQRLVMIGLFPTVALMLAGPDVYEIVFGAEWRTAGTFLQYLGPWLFLASVAAPLTTLFDVLERQRLDLLTSVFMFIVLASAMIAGGRTGDVTTLLLYIGVAGVAARVLHLVVLLRLARTPVALVMKPYVRYTLFSLPGLLLIIGGLWLDSAWWTTGATMLGGALYAGLVLWRDRLLAYRPPPQDPSA